MSGGHHELDSAGKPGSAGTPQPTAPPSFCQAAVAGLNQVLTWDIAKLLGPVEWTHCYRCVLLDLFSRFVVGWLIAERENAALAEDLIAQCCARQSIQPSQLRRHSDRGGPITAKLLALLLADPGVT